MRIQIRVLQGTGEERGWWKRSARHISLVVRSEGYTSASNPYFHRVDCNSFAHLYSFARGNSFFTNTAAHTQEVRVFTQKLGWKAAYQLEA